MPPSATRPCSIVWSTSARPRPTTRTARSAITTTPTPSARPGSMWPGCRRPRRGARIKARPPSVAMALAGALDDWAAIRRDKRKDAAGAASLSQAAQIADPDPWRTDLRNALDEPDKAARLTRLQAVEKKANYDALGPISLHLLGSGLIKADDPALAESVLRKAQERHPRDVWINYVLGQALEKQSRGDEAIRFYTAARAIRPETAHELAHALEKRGDRDEAIAVFRDLRGLRPGNARHLGCLGEALKATGRTREAEEAFEAAIVAGREEVRLKPGSANAHFNLGRALRGQGPGGRGHRLLQEGHRTRPEVRHGPQQPGHALKDKGQVDEAIACYKKAIELDPKFAMAHDNLGTALKDKGQLDEAIACYKKAIELDPKFAMAHNNLGDCAAMSRASGRGHRLLPARPSNSTRRTPAPTPTWALR